MQVLQNEFKNLISSVIEKRTELLMEGLNAYGIDKEWVAIPENKKRCKFVEVEDTENGGFKTSCFLDDELIFEVICIIDHKAMNVISELRFVKKENEDVGSKEM